MTFIHCQRFRMCVTSKGGRSCSNLNQYAIRLLVFSQFLRVTSYLMIGKYQEIMLIVILQKRNFSFCQNVHVTRSM